MRIQFIVLSSLIIVFIFSIQQLVAQNSTKPEGTADITYAVGADMSFLKSAEDNGKQFKDNGEVKAGLDIFKSHGYNWIRLRLFHSPDELPNDLEYH